MRIKMKRIILIALLVSMSFINKGYAGEAFRGYLENELPNVSTQISQGNFQSVFNEIKVMLNNKKLKKEEKLYILDKYFELAKNLGYFAEGGQIYELSYSVDGVDKDLAKTVHAKLTKFYEDTRSWQKAIKTHFYYLQHVKVEDKEKKEILFSIVSNYINLLQFKKAERVLGEILQSANENRDFAYVFYYQALCHFSQNEYKEAIRFYEKALSFDVLDTVEKGRSYYNMGLCYEINNEIKNALINYKKAEEFYENKIVIFKRMERLKNKSPRIYNEVINEKSKS